MKLNLWHRLSIAFAVLAVCLTLTGCGVPTWLSDATSIIPVLISTVLSIASFIAGLTGNAVPAAVLAAISEWANKIELGLKNVESLVENYKSNPSDTLLEEIDSIAKTVVSDVGTFAQIEGVPALIAGKMQAFAQLILTQLEAWISLLPTLKSTVAAGTTLSIAVPMTHAAFKAQHNALLTTPTGDTEVDAALTKAKKI